MNLLHVLPILLIISLKTVATAEVVTEIVIGSDEVEVTEIGLDVEEVYSVQGYNNSKEGLEYSNVNNDTTELDDPNLKVLTLHLRTYRKTIYKVLPNGTVFEDFTCVAPSSIEDFPEDLFTDEQLKKGAVILHFIAAVYCFTLLAVVCNDYFIPSVECICEDLHIAPNVAAATFMAVATSCPEFFVNVISTFVTESDMGLGTIVGSALFNTLGVGALGGLAASKAIRIERWPLIRDCVIYSVTIAMLVAISWDGVVYWYEAIALLVMYVFYFILMFQNDRIQRSITKLGSKLCKNNEVDICGGRCNDWDGNNNGDKTPPNGINNECYVSTEKPTSIPHNIVTAYIIPIEENEKHHNYEKANPLSENQLELPQTVSLKTRKSLWKIPESNTFKKLWWFYTWPIKMLLTITVPSPKTWRKLYPITFIMCIAWIGVNAYLVFWMVAVIGVTLGVPDSVMGMTFLAAGGCLPEAISIVIMSRKGIGGMGVSNSLGANTLAVLMSLGMPWFIKTVKHGISHSSLVYIDSGGVVYTIIALLLAVWSLFTILSCGGYQMSKRTGSALMLTYLLFVILAILSEMGIFFDQC
uniref:Putative k+-dependent ca2+/na+ exchanger nckx1 n=1 Tax=Xenopsylla cheopis TaxID=163159 RepID=A0A6M2DWZ8_XENCH